jgi:hypothetical protein
MITKAQWEQISHFMKGLYNTIEFELDGRNIKVTKAFVSENKVAYVVYIDNQLAPGMGFQNMKNYDPFTEKVWRRRSKAVYSVARVKEIEKAFGKRDAKKHFPNLHKSTVWFDPCFTTASSVVSQFKKNPNLVLKTNLMEISHAA